MLHALSISSSLIIFGEEYRLQSSSLCSHLQLPSTSALLGPHILPSIHFSNIHSPSLSARNKVSHSYKTTDKIVFLYFEFCFRRGDGETQSVCIE